MNQDESNTLYITKGVVPFDFIYYYFMLKYIISCWKMFSNIIFYKIKPIGCFIFEK